jgi:limonene-1,2-epoxide hydrolase
VLLGTLLLQGLAQPVYAQSLQMSPEERAAVGVVREWCAAWEKKDPEKVASYMSPNVEFRGTPWSPLSRGRAAFVQQLGGVIRTGPGVRVTEAFAISGPAGIAVLIKRVDANTDGRVVPLAEFFFVSHGQIEQWLDEPLVQLAPPGGARQPADAPKSSN